MNNATLQTVDLERDLGVVINKNGKYSKQCLMAKKANCVLGMIKEILNVRMLLLLWDFINPWCDLDWSIAYRLDLFIIRRILRFMDMRT